MELPRRVLVLGLRRTGQAVARVLVSRGCTVRAADALDASALGLDSSSLPGAELRLGPETPVLLDDVDLVVPSPGVPRSAPLLREAVRRGLPVWAEVELAFRLLDCPVIGITGTNGKSTTTTLVGRALAAGGRRVFTGGNLGTPLVLAAADPPDVAVTEVSSFQLEWVERFRPRVAGILNITADHLDRHADFAEYRDAKARLLAAQQPDDCAVLNRDDPETIALAAGSRARVLTFGAGPSDSGATLGAGAAIVRLPGADEERYDLVRTRLAGRHNVENILAAALIARLAGASPAAVQEAIDTVEPLPHRLALVAERHGVRWFDDSKATNVGATVKSLESFAEPVVLLAGGVDKGGDYGPLAAAARGRVRRALVFGAARERLAAALEAAEVAVERVADLPAAVGAAASAACAGDVVLLAPACSSFDMFTDYAARGRAFRAAVEGLR
jgi:UDP-N-acetylmuramoylalanine--D-glutamate ligase